MHILDRTTVENKSKLIRSCLYIFSFNGKMREDERVEVRQVFCP